VLSELQRENAVQQAAWRNQDLQSETDSSLTPLSSDYDPNEELSRRADSSEDLHPRWAASVTAEVNNEPSCDPPVAPSPIPLERPVFSSTPIMGFEVPKVDSPEDYDKWEG
jgi:hypothetical protein